jgi:hypothetical protein
MVAAFQSTAFQNNAFQVGDAVIDTHDFADWRRSRGDGRKRKWEQDATDREQRKREVVATYERLVEGKPDEARAIVEDYIRPSQRNASAPTVNFDRLMNDADQLSRLWAAYIAMDDEEVMMLL